MCFYFLQIMSRYASTIMKTPIKYFTLVISIILAASGVYGAIHVDQSFDQLVLGLEGSAYVKYFRYFNKAYPTGSQISVIIDIPVDYSDSYIQSSIRHLDQIAIENPYTKPLVLNWMTSFLQWAQQNNQTSTGENFFPTLMGFLQTNKQFYVDLKMENGKILASRVMMMSKDSPLSIYRRDAMLSLRNDLKEKSDLPVYAISYIYILIEQFVVILPDTVRNLIICACAILIITLPYLVYRKTTFFVFFNFVSLIFELLGIMFLWDVSLNGISMIIIVMAIGFAVDYSAHIAHAFIMSTEHQVEKRVVDALKTMGSSVTMGG